MSDVTLGTGAEQLRDALFDGGMKSSRTVVDNLISACNGDVQPLVTPATYSAAATTAAVTKTATVTLATADGDTHEWYSGNVTLAITNTGTGSATVTLPTSGAGTYQMVNGLLGVAFTTSGTWTAGATVTLTAYIPATQAGLMCKTSAATCVLTFA